MLIYSVILPVKFILKIIVIDVPKALAARMSSSALFIILTFGN